MNVARVVLVVFDFDLKNEKNVSIHISRSLLSSLDVFVFRTIVVFRNSRYNRKFRESEGESPQSQTREARERDIVEDTHCKTIQLAKNNGKRRNVARSNFFFSKIEKKNE